MRLLIATIAVFTFVSCHFKRQEADLVIYNATIYTLDESNTIGQAMAIKDGKIVAIGKERDILNNFRYTEGIDAKKQFIYPGLIDAHCHFVNYGLGLNNVDLRGCKSFSEVLERLTSYKKNNPNANWVVGRGWDHTDWPNKEWPSKEKIDELFPNTPVLLHRVDGHSALVNQAVFNLAGFTSKTLLAGGVIDVKGGELTGIIKENTIDSVMKLIPAPTTEQLLQGLKRAEKNCLAVGLTSVQDAGLDNKTLLAVQKIYQDQLLAIRMYAMASDNEENFRFFEKNGPIISDNFTVNSFKFYADGSLGSRSACLKKPYSDDIHETGIITTNLADLAVRYAKVYAMNFQANTHAIGDSANGAVLQLYANVLKQSNDRRWRIEHAQVVSKQDRHFFTDYAILPSVQPTHATSDAKWAADRLGSSRINEAYAYQELLSLNGLLALGTDFPVEDINPLHTFYSAVFRKNIQGEPTNGFQLENALTRIQALKAMTIWAAVASKEEHLKGSLENGKLADLVILDKDLFTVPEKDMLKTKVTKTIIGGKVKYAN